MFSHFSRGAQKGAKGGTRQSTADADAFDSNRRECCQAQRNAWNSHEHVDRAIHRADQSSNVVLAGKAWSVENIGARFLVGLEPLDRVFQITPAVEVILRTRSERKGKTQGTRTLGRRAHSLRRQRLFIDRMLPRARLHLRSNPQPLPRRPQG